MIKKLKEKMSEVFKYLHDHGTDVELSVLRNFLEHALESFKTCEDFGIPAEPMKTTCMVGFPGYIEEWRTLIDELSIEDWTRLLPQIYESVSGTLWEERYRRELPKVFLFARSCDVQMVKMLEDYPHALHPFWMDKAKQFGFGRWTVATWMSGENKFGEHEWYPDYAGEYQ